MNSDEMVRALDPGEPIEVVVRVAEEPPGVTGAGACIVKNDKIRVMPDQSRNYSNPEDEFTFSRIYESGSDVPFKEQNGMVFEEFVGDRVRKFVDEAFNVSVIALGESKTGKSSFLVGEAGMLQQASARVLDLCEMKGQEVASGEEFDHYDRKLRLSMFEIYEEEIRDLSVSQEPILNRDGKDGRILQVTNNSGRRTKGPIPGGAEMDLSHVQGGTWVEGLTYTEIDDAKQVQPLLSKARRNAKTHVTDFGPGAYFTTTFYVLELKQRFHSSRLREPAEMVSRLTFVDLAGAEKLKRDLSELQDKEGSILNKSIMSFGAVVQKMTDRPDRGGIQEPALVNWEQSTLTMLLRQALSSNCLSLAVAMLAPWNYAESKVTLEYAKRLKQLRTFPVSGESQQRGLLRDFREEIHALKEDLSQAQSANGQLETTEVWLKIKEVEDKALILTGEKAKLIAEKEQLFERFRTLREKFNNVVEESYVSKEKLITKEEEFLTVSKALLDMEVERTEFKEISESSKFDVMNKLLNAENQMVENEMKIQEMTRATDKMAETMQTTLNENKQLSLELVAMKENFENLKEDLENMQKEKDDIGLETVILVNHKKEHMRQIDRLTLESNQKADEIKRLEDELHETKNVGDGKEGQVGALKLEIEDLKERLHLAEHALATKTVEFEAGKIKVEQGFVTDTRTKDMEIMLLKEKYDEEGKKMQGTQKRMDDHITELQLELRNQKQNVIDVDTALALAQKDYETAQRTNHDLQTQLQEYGDEYRHKLRLNMELLTEMQKTVGGVTEDSSADAAFALQGGMDAMLQDVVKSHVIKEEELNAVVEKYKARITHLVARNHKYAQAHLKCREQVIKLTPLNQEPDYEKSVEELKVEYEGEVENDRERELKSVQERLRQLEIEEKRNQEEKFETRTSHQETLLKLNKETQAMTRQIGRLQQENKTIMSENKALQTGMAAAGANTEQILELEKKSLAAVNDLKTNGIQMKEITGDMKIEDVRLETQMHQLMQEKAQLLEVIEQKNTEMQRAINDQNELRRVRFERDHLVQQMQVITGGDNTRQRLSDMVVQLQNKLKERGEKTEDGGSSDLRKEMREFALTKQKELEKERAELKMKLTMAEVKLNGMEEYMDKTIKEYQVEIVKLRNKS